MGRAVIDAWWRAANYLSVEQIYLLDNPLVRGIVANAYLEGTYTEVYPHIGQELIAARAARELLGVGTPG